MKKIFLFVLLFICLKGLSQYPVKQTLGSDSTLVESKGALKGRIVNKPFSDTTQANTQRVKFYDGSQIWTTTDNKFWLRDSAANKWTEVGSGGGGGAGVSDGDKGHITVSGSGATWSLNTNVVANDLFRQSAALSIVGNSTNATANIADITAGVDGYVLRRSGTTLGFGQIATAGITDAAVTYAKIQNISANNRLLGRMTTGGVPEELTGTQVTTILDVFNSSLKGLTPASGGGTTNFLRADGTWAAPEGSITDGDKGDITVSGTQSVFTIDANAVSDAKFRQSVGLSLVGRSANSTGNVADITAGTDGQVMRRSGTAIAFGALNLANANAVTGVLPIANIATGTPDGTKFVSDAGTLLVPPGFSDPLTTNGDLLARISGATTRFPGNSTAVKKMLTQTSSALSYDTAAIISTAGGTIGDAVIWNGGQNFILGTSAGRTDSTGVLEFEVDATDAPAAGDSLLTSTALIGKWVEVYRYGELQSRDTIYGIEVDTTTGEVQVHPPYEASEKIIIKAYNYPSVYSIALEPPEETWVDLTFTTQSGLLNTANVWTPTGGTGWSATHGLDVLTLTGDGAYRIKYQASDGDAVIIGFNASNTSQDYPNYEYGVYLVDGGAIWKVVNGTPSSASATLSTGEYLILNRIGSTFYIRTSTDGELPGTVVHTFAATSSATHYLNLNVFAAPPGKCYFPQGFGLQ